MKMLEIMGPIWIYARDWPAPLQSARGERSSQLMRIDLLASLDIRHLPCPVHGCRDLEPHVHDVCGVCKAVDYLNPHCPQCRAVGAPHWVALALDTPGRRN